MKYFAVIPIVTLHFLPTSSTKQKRTSLRVYCVVRPRKGKRSLIENSFNANIARAVGRRGFRSLECHYSQTL